MPKETELVVWYNKDELQQVYKKLYTGKPIEQRWAVEKVSEWKSRMKTCFPIPVEVTTAIVRARIQDNLVCNDLMICSLEDVSLLYSMALVRFCNMICELKQTKLYKIPMRIIAQELDIPSWIIKIRNDVTHGQPPHVERLREAANVALLWLQENYWEQELEVVIDYVPQNPKLLEEDIRDTICEYQERRYKSLFLSRCKKEIPKERPLIASVLAKLTAQANKDKNLLINTLVKPEFLLSITARTKSILSDDNFIEEETIELPLSIEKFWAPVIKIVCQKKLLEVLIVALLKCHVNNQPQDQRMAIAWVFRILKLLEALEGREIKEKSPISQILQKNQICLDWKKILYVGLKSATKYVTAVLPILAKHVDPPPPDDWQSNAMALVAIYIGSVPVLSSSDDEQKEMYTLEDIKAAMEMMHTIKRGEDTLFYTENPWELVAKDDDYTTVHTRGQITEGKNLYLFDIFPSEEESEKPTAEQTVEVPMELDLHIEDGEIEFFDIKSFEENAAMEKCTQEMNGT